MGQSPLAPVEGVGSVGPRPSKRQGNMIMNKELNRITNDSRGLYKVETRKWSMHFHSDVGSQLNDSTPPPWTLFGLKPLTKGKNRTAE